MTSSGATARPIGIVSLAAWFALGYPALKAIDPLVGKFVGFSVFVAYVMLVVPAAMGLVAGRLRESCWRRLELMRPRDLVAHLAGDAQGTHALGDAIEDRG